MADVNSAVQDIIANVGKVINDLLTLKVETRVVEVGADGTIPDVDAAHPAKLIASTELKIEGDATYIVPIKNGEPQTTLNTLHEQHVEAAKEYRLNQLKLVAEVIQSLAGQANKPPGT